MIKRFPNSFRDPCGFVFEYEGDIYRFVFKYLEKNWQSFVESGLFFDLQEKGYLQPSKILQLDDYRIFSPEINNAIALVKHERKIPCISYPFEWPFSMLKDAALFHLDFLEACLDKGFITKDGTPYNIQFEGVRPIFIDILSVAPYISGNVWFGFNQFLQQFLFPLLLMSNKNIPFFPRLRFKLEGIDIYTVKKFFHLTDIFKPGVFSYIFLPLIFQKIFSSFSESIREKIFSSGIMDKRAILKNTSHLKKLVNSLSVSKKQLSLWKDYEENNSYSQNEKSLKHEFIVEAMKVVRPDTILDLGANAGEYSIICSPYAKNIIAIDSDQEAVDILYDRLKEKGIKNILPLVVDIINPSPNLGWKLKEYPSFFERVKPDTVFCLALVHHIVIGNNVPIEDFVEWLEGLAPNIIVEFVSKDDPKVKILLRERNDIYPDYNKDFFEHCIEKRANIVKKMTMPSGSRTLYLLKRKS